MKKMRLQRLRFRGGARSGCAQEQDTDLDKRIFGDPGTSAFRVDRYPFYLVNRLASRYNAIIEPRLRSIGLDIPNWRVLMILGERSPRGVSEIADAAVIPLSTMTRIVQRMTAADLAVTQPSEHDARVTSVALTDFGKAKLAEARVATSPIYNRVIHGLSDEDLDRLTALLNALYENLDGD